MIDDITRAVELSSRSAHPGGRRGRDRLAEIGDGGKANVVDDVIAEIIADSAEKKDSEDGGGHHAPDGRDVGRHKVVEIKGVVKKGYPERRAARSPAG